MLWATIIPDTTLSAARLLTYLNRSRNAHVEVSLCFTRDPDWFGYKWLAPRLAIRIAGLIAPHVHRIQVLRIGTDDHSFFNSCTSSFHKLEASSLRYLEVKCWVPEGEKYISTIGEENDDDFEMPDAPLRSEQDEQLSGIRLFFAAPLLSYSHLENIYFREESPLLAKNLRLKRTHEFVYNVNGEMMVSSSRDVLEHLVV
jgi:hypothetical protein